jgi:hypothetical protein
MVQGKLSRLMADVVSGGGAEGRVATEDEDAAPSVEVAACDRGHIASCVFVDDAGQLLWVADRDGWVYGGLSAAVGKHSCRSL